MRIELTITNQSKSIPESLELKIQDLSFDNGGNGIEVYPKNDDFPMPWDAVCYIEGNEFIIDGDLGQQGSSKAWAKVGIPLDKVMNYVGLSIYVEDKEAESEIRKIFSEYGWL